MTGPFRERYCSGRRLTQTCRPGTSPAPRQPRNTATWERYPAKRQDLRCTPGRGFVTTGRNPELTVIGRTGAPHDPGVVLCRGSALVPLGPGDSDLGPAPWSRSDL